MELDFPERARMAYPHTEKREPLSAALPDWDDFRLLLAVVQLGSFSRAAASLGLTQPTVSRRVEKLEESLGVRLMDRSPSGAVLTPEGQRIVAELHVAHGALMRAVKTVHYAEQRIDDVKLLTTDGLATYWLPGLLPFLFDSYPELELRVHTATSPDVEQRGHHDLQIHYIQPTDPNLVTVRLGTLHFIPYASPAYLAKHGHPGSTAELGRHRLLDYVLYLIDKGTWMTRLPAVVGEGRAQFFTNSSAALCESVRAGAGIALLPTYGSVLLDKLVPIDVGLRFETPFWLCYRQDAFAKRSVRLAVAFMKHAFNRKTMPWFAERFVPPSEFPATTPAQIMADFSGETATLSGVPALFGST
jgi:molybdate transport repressor ModE-like protein